MLLRSASSPILKPNTAKKPFPTGGRTPATKIRVVSASPAARAIPRTSSDGNLLKMPIPVSDKKMGLQSDAGAGGGGGYHRSGGGGGGGGGDGYESLEEYYEEMIRLYPDDALLLANYARFLKEVKGDEIKAEEYCERAILAKGYDGNLLSMYGDLIWNNHKDDVRAESYFHQALHSSPNDCCVLASYARFLWDAEDNEDEDEEMQTLEEEGSSLFSMINNTNTDLFLGQPAPR